MGNRGKVSADVGVSPANCLRSPRKLQINSVELAQRWMGLMGAEEDAVRSSEDRRGLSPFVGSRV